MSEWIYGSIVGATKAHFDGADVEWSGDGMAWYPVGASFRTDWQYRWRKPVVSREVTLKYAPMTERPKQHTRYCVPSAITPEGFTEFVCQGGPMDERVFERGMCFTEEAVKEYVKQHGWVK